MNKDVCIVERPTAVRAHVVLSRQRGTVSGGDPGGSEGSTDPPLLGAGGLLYDFDPHFLLKSLCMTAQK